MYLQKYKLSETPEKLWYYIVNWIFNLLSNYVKSSIGQGKFGEEKIKVEVRKKVYDELPEDFLIEVACWEKEIYFIVLLSCQMRITSRWRKTYLL